MSLQREIEKRAARQAFGAEYRKYMRWTGRALEVPLSVVVGVALGVFLERHFDIAPWGMALGLFFGIATGVRFGYRLYHSYLRENP
ncbi:MAG TPA: AtpZ/AtpI family protein [Myxococcota bacterium]|jgi:F0F1-type ATP synthase assembly protein I